MASRCSNPDFSGQEMIDNLDEMFASRLRLWQAKNKVLPENILIYRDGVSEGQYQTVLGVELGPDSKGLRETGPCPRHKERPSVYLNHRRRQAPPYAVLSDESRGRRPFFEPTERHHRGPRRHRGSQLGFLFAGPHRAPRHSATRTLLCHFGRGLPETQTSRRIRMRRMH